MIEDEITGGRFWRSCRDGKHEGDDRYEHLPAPPPPAARPSDTRLLNLAKALGPSYIRDT